MIDLNTRIKHAPPGLVLTDAIAISDTGAIVADSNVGLVLLKPSAHGADAPVVEPIGRHGCRQDWLAGLTLNMTEGQSIKVFGESMIVTLPCGKLDL